MLSFSKLKSFVQTTIKICNTQLYKNAVKQIHTTAPIAAWAGENKPKKWLKYNKVVYSPQLSHEEPRPAFICHMKANIKYSPWKMWYIASFVRGMSADEALKQLKFMLKRGARDVAETIEEAKRLAIAEQNVEYGTNLWVAESFVGKGHVVKGIRRHARGRTGKVEYFHCHYFVRLEEGVPPEHYYTVPKQPHEQLEDWVKHMRDRKSVV